MNQVLFTKMTGAGNDFIFIDRKINPDLVIDTTLIQKLCNRRFGVGADGLITVDDSSDIDFVTQYFNADGSTGSLCANGARCSIWFAELTGRLKSRIARFISNGVEYSGIVVSDELIQFNFNQPKDFKLNFKLKVSDQSINASFVDTGSPHVVINISDIQKYSGKSDSGFEELSEIPVYSLGREIRFNNDFKPNGTNVNFIKVINNVIHIRTYERGVEDETLACGTGSVAAALIGYINYNLQPPITLKTFGGDNLVVNFNSENQKVKNLSLTGPAKKVFEGSIDLKFFIQ